MSKRICDFPDCGRPFKGRGLCAGHLKQLREKGELAPLRYITPGWSKPTIPIADRFWHRVDKNGPVPELRPDLGPCWIWRGTLFPTGYGQFPLRNSNAPAHRVSYELVVGEIPEGLNIDHLCFVRSCVNPSHLEPVTQLMNIRRAHAAGRVPLKQECSRGHAYTEENTYRAPNGERQCRKCIRIRAEKQVPLRRERRRQARLSR